MQGTSGLVSGSIRLCSDLNFAGACQSPQYAGCLTFRPQTAKYWQLVGSFVRLTDCCVSLVTADPLGLGKDEDQLKWYAQAELQNARWAMLGVAGILVAELTGHDWYTAGAQSTFADTKTLFAIEFFLMAWVETRRLQDMRKPGSVNQDPIFTNNKLPDGNEPGYPGGIFDPAGFAKGDLTTLKLKEIKNGRLAMTAFLGFVAQHAATGKGPLANLADHLAAPFSNHFITNGVSLPFLHN